MFASDGLSPDPPVFLSRATMQEFVQDPVTAIVIIRAVRVLFVFAENACVFYFQFKHDYYPHYHLKCIIFWRFYTIKIFTSIRLLELSLITHFRCAYYACCCYGYNGRNG